MNYYGIYPENDYRYYLQHHGIKGQKWGVQNGPPYPLSREVNLEIRKNRIHTQKEAYEDEWYTSKNSEHFNNSPKIEKVSELDKKEKTLKSYKKSIKDDLIAVNPSYGTSMIGGVFNCRNCATAFELRRRGYDVEARRRDDGSNAGGAEKYFKNGKFKVLKNDFDNDDFFNTKYIEPSGPFVTKAAKNSYEKEYWSKLDKYHKKAYDNLCSELLKQGRGARGIVVIGWQADDYDMTKRTSFFHAFNYEVRDEVEFYDSQSSDRESIEYSYGFSYEYADPRDYSYMRTDDLELSNKVGEAVVSKSKSDRKGRHERR